MNQTETIKLIILVLIIVFGARAWVRYVMKKLIGIRKECTSTEEGIFVLAYLAVTPIVSLSICFGSAAIVNACEYLITGKIT